MKLFGMRIALAAGVSLALAGAVGAEQPQGALFLPGPSDTLVAGPSDWGTTTNIIEVIDASDLESFFGNGNGVDANSGHRFCILNATCGWMGGVSLPSGALLTSIELDACDTDATSQVLVAVFKSVKGGGLLQSPALINTGTGTAAVPGCSTFAANLATPETINNLTTNYLVDILSGPSNTTRFRAIRLIYRLQVSAAPATATFPNDVPTSHPFFRFVEAMAASGLTGGCGAGSFCPDAPVTRGQLSVFLASALGLHFPN